jgi:hypothetical protein
MCCGCERDWELDPVILPCLAACQTRLWLRGSSVRSCIGKIPSNCRRRLLTHATYVATNAEAFLLRTNLGRCTKHECDVSTLCTTPAKGMHPGHTVNIIHRAFNANSTWALKITGCAGQARGRSVTSRVLRAHPIMHCLDLSLCRCISGGSAMQLPRLHWPRLKRA